MRFRKESNKDGYLIEISLIFICVYAIIYFKQITYEFMKLEKLKSLLISEDLRVFSNLPREYIVIKEILYQHFEKISKYKSISQTIRYIEHDIKAPFTTLKIASEILYSSKNDPKKIVENLDLLKPEINRATSSIQNMIKNILTVSEETILHKENVNFTMLIYDALFTQTFLSRASDIYFHYDIKNEYTILGDKECLKRVFQNIIQNAYQAIGRQNKQTISIYISDNKNNKKVLDLSIKNTGSYIESEKIHGIFDDFSTHGKVKGAGLGLAIAKKFILLHQGTIKVESNSNEPSTTFHISIPYVESKEVDLSIFPKSTTEIKNSMKLAKRTLTTDINECKKLSQKISNELKNLKNPILLGVIDNDTFVGDYLAAMIGNNAILKNYINVVFIPKEDYEVCVEVDLLICDIDLTKNYSGVDIIKNYKRKITKNVSICVHSNRVFGDEIRRCLLAGADYFLPKPMDKIQLLKFIEDSLTYENNTKSNISFRPIKEDDHIKLNNILRKAKKYNGYSSEYIKSFMKKASITPETITYNKGLLILKNKKIIGFYIIDLEKVFLDYLFMDVNYIGEGYGSLLWKKAVNQFERLGINKFYIWSDPNANEFYVKMGCYEIEKKESPYWEGLQTTIFEYQIKK